MCYYSVQHLFKSVCGYARDLPRIHHELGVFFILFGIVLSLLLNIEVLYGPLKAGCCVTSRQKCLAGHSQYTLLDQQLKYFFFIFVQKSLGENTSSPEHAE